MKENSGPPSPSLDHVYAMVSAVNRLIVRASEPQAIFDGACRIAVEKGGFCAAWVGILELHETGKILRSAASAASSESYLNFLQLNLAGSQAAATRPCLQAALSGKPQVSNDLWDNPDAELPCDPALKQSCRSVVAFPLKIAGETIGAFALYAAKEFF